MKIQPARIQIPGLPSTGPLWREVVKRVACPYCRVGGALYTFKQAVSGPQTQMPMDVVLECDSCSHPNTGRPNRFRVAMQLKLVGVGLDHPAGRLQ